jgi:hypothetical protein
MLDGSDSGLDVAMAGNHNDRHLGVLLLDSIEQLQTIEFAALQPDIEKHQIWSPRRDRAQRIIAAARGTRTVTLILQDARDKIADIRLIIDYQNFSGHVLLTCDF